MSVYSNIDIKNAIKKGTIVCVPYNEKNVNCASLDFTLGYYYYKQEMADEPHIYNPFSKDDVKRYFKGPFKAISNKEWCDKYGYKVFKNIPENQPIIVLHPGERILAHTHEFVGIRKEGGACDVKSRSSWGRNGVAICFDAGWIDPGYINRITLEIYNLNKHESVVLPVGERIGQLVFHTTGEVDGDYSNNKNGISGKYQATNDLNKLISSWKPEDILPKAYLDAQNIPEKIVGLSDGIY